METYLTFFTEQRLKVLFKSHSFISSVIEIYTNDMKKIYLNIDVMGNHF